MTFTSNPRPVPAQGAFELSPTQMGLWAAELWKPNSSANVTAQYSDIGGALDVADFERASRQVIEETEALRLCFNDPLDPPLQWVAPLDDWSLPLIDLSATPDPHAASIDWMKAQLAQPLEVNGGRAFRWTLLQLSPTRFMWSFQVHHLLLDGFSRNAVWRRLDQVYSALVAGAAVPPGDCGSLAELFAQEREYDCSAASNEDRRYFTELLKDRPARTSLAGEAAAETREFRRATAYLPTDVTERLRAFVSGASLAAVVTTAAALMQRSHTGGDDLVIGLAVSARVSPLARRTPSMLSNVVPLRLRLSHDLSIDEAVTRTRSAIRAVLPHQRYPLRILRNSLKVSPMEPDPFALAVNYMPFDMGATFGGHDASTHNLSNGPVADLAIGVFDSPGQPRLRVDLNGNGELYDDIALSRHLDRMVAALAAVASGPATRAIGDILSWPAAEAAQVESINDADRRQVAHWNSTAADYPRDRTLTWLLRAQSRRTPAAIAVEIGDCRLTYADLYERADALAARLKQSGVSRGARVGLFLDRHPTLPQAMLAILEAGGGYVPLDPTFPRERLAFMIADAEVCAIVTRRALLSELPSHAIPAICVDDDLPAGPAAAGWLPAHSSSLAYVLYTSGSTGTPKGVAIEHRQLVNFLTSMARQPGMNANDALLAITSISFDIAGLEIWLPLLCGARLCLAGREEAADAVLLGQALQRSGATVLQATPSTWRALLASGWHDAGLKALVGGDALPADLAELLSTRCGEAWNLYGPTETTIWSSAWRLPRPAGRVSVGRAIANTQLHVLDAELRQLPIGLPGDLFIGGEGVARGYLNRPELTSHCFVLDPFRGGAARMYRTGDLARWLPDGTLELLGRNDDQLKVRGHRIEAGEVESALLRLPGVSQAVVTLARPKTGDPRLVAYLVPEAGAQIAPSTELRAQLCEWLAEYMLPYHFVPLAALPLTLNGKVDRRRLTEMGAVPEPAPAQLGSIAEASVLEAEIMGHFSRLLGCTVTLDSDFFEAGGESLGVLRLIARILQERGLELTSGDLFQHSTPRLMAARLEQLVAGAARPRHLAPLRKGCGAGAVILVHPKGGHLASYGRLAHLLGASVNLFGLQAGTGRQVYTSLEARCAAYVEEVMAATSGPLILGGYSLGGALAVEMAERLRRLGREVSAVLLLDAPVPRPLKHGWPKLRHRTAELWRFAWHDRLLWLRDQLSRRLRLGRSDVREFGEAGKLIDETEIDSLLTQAFQWQPPHYAGKVCLFRAERNLRGYANPPGPLGWERYCPTLEVLSLPCNHHEIMVEPQVLRIVAAIERLAGAPTSIGTE